MKENKFSLHIKEEPSLSEILDKVMDTGVVIQGDLTISLADVDLIHLSLQLLITSVENLADKPALQNPEKPCK